MDPLALTTGAASSKSFFTSKIHLLSSSSERRRTARTLYFNHKSNAFTVYASQEESPKLDSYDQMELKFGRLLGEDPKLTLAKIMGRKANPDASYLDIEKSFYKNKGKLVKVEEIPFDVSKEGKSSSSLDDLGLKRPVPIKGTKFNSDDKKVELEVKKPVPIKGTNFSFDDKKPTQPQPASKSANNNRSSVPNVILRKPTVYKEEDDVSSRLRIKPNLSLKMGNGQVKEKFSDMTLLRKPEPSIPKDADKKIEPSKKEDARLTYDIELKMRLEEPDDKLGNLTLLGQPERVGGKTEYENGDERIGDVKFIAPNDIDKKALGDTFESAGNASVTENKLGTQYGLIESEQKLDTTEWEQQQQRLLESSQEPTDSRHASDVNTIDPSVKLSMEVALQGKPKRLDQSVKRVSTSTGEETAFVNPGHHENTNDFDNLIAMSDIKESEYADWSRAEYAVKTGDRIDVELVSCSTRGFAASFGSLIGFLPYRNLAPKWKFLAFESWLRRQGLDPSVYRQSLGIITNNYAENKNLSPGSAPYMKIDTKVEEKISSDMKLEDLLRIYDHEKIKFLSSFIGQKVKVNVTLADRNFRKFTFSLRPKENEELVKKKRNLMARLQVGDIVKCCIQKITYVGIFVEVEGVPALIHQTEVSWDATLDPASYYKIGQVVEAKVYQLNFALDRIFLSLKETMKETMPDPLMESLKAVVGDCEPLDGRFQVAQMDTEWSEVESLIKELQQMDEIQSVSKGRFFLSPGLAPTFQVYMASIFENQYKLLARSGNRIQEIVVQTSLDKEKMKSAIMTCTNRV